MTPGMVLMEIEDPVSCQKNLIRVRETLPNEKLLIVSFKQDFSF